VLSPFLPSDAEPAAGHPCFGCAVRERAVCGVLGCEALGTFKRMGHTVRLKPGQALFHEGDPARQVFTVTRGSVKLYRLLSDGRRQVTAFLFPGDFLGLGPDAAHESAPKPWTTSSFAPFRAAASAISSMRTRAWNASSTASRRAGSAPPAIR